MVIEILNSSEFAIHVLSHELVGIVYCLCARELQCGVVASDEIARYHTRQNSEEQEHENFTG